MFATTILHFWQRHVPVSSMEMATVNFDSLLESMVSWNSGQFLHLSTDSFVPNCMLKLGEEASSSSDCPQIPSFHCCHGFIFGSSSDTRVTTLVWRVPIGWSTELFWWELQENLLLFLTSLVKSPSRPSGPEEALIVVVAPVSVGKECLWFLETIRTHTKILPSFVNCIYTTQKREGGLGLEEAWDGHHPEKHMS